MYANYVSMKLIKEAANENESFFFFIGALATFVIFIFVMSPAAAIFSTILAFIPAVIAVKKNHKFWRWYVFGQWLLIAALPCALLAQDETKRKCNFCCEVIDVAAKVCPHCRNDPYGVPKRREE